MAKRKITLIELKDLIELGDIQYKSDNHAWIYFKFLHRVDNLVCAAVVDKDAIILKTVMVHWLKR